MKTLTLPNGTQTEQVYRVCQTYALFELTSGDVTVFVRPESRPPTNFVAARERKYRAKTQVSQRVSASNPGKNTITLMSMCDKKFRLKLRRSFLEFASSPLSLLDGGA